MYRIMFAPPRDWLMDHWQDPNHYPMEVEGHFHSERVAELRADDFCYPRDWYVVEPYENDEEVTS